MGEKAPPRPLFEDNPSDNFVHPTAPPSYDEAMNPASQYNQPLNTHATPYQGHAPQMMQTPAVPQSAPVGMPVYPQQVVNVPPVPTQMAVVNVPVQTALVAVGPKGTRMRCYHCHADIKTTTMTTNKAIAHLACLILCIFTCCLCWIPYCMDSCKRVDHKCPNCKRFIGSYNA